MNLYNNKINKIVIEDLKIATQSMILIDFDSYFIGVTNQKRTNLTYKLADLDNITKHKINDKLLTANISEFLNTMDRFLKYFVSNASEYQNTLNNLITKYLK